MTIFLEAVVAGLGIGSVYALIALGYALIMACSSVFNLAQGTIVMGGVLSFLGLWETAHWPFIVALILIAIGGAVAGVATYGLSIYPLLRNVRLQGHQTENALITTFGLSIALTAIAGQFFGYNTYTVNNYVTNSPIKLGSVPISPIYIVMLGVAIVVFTIIELGLRKSLLGIRLRAVVADPEGAGIVGISVKKVIFWSFFGGGAIAAIAGLLIAPVTAASVQVGSTFAFYGFVGISIGGFGSFTGTLVGGLLVGLLTNIAAIWAGPDLVLVILELFLVVVLCIRPRGLFGRAGTFGSGRLREI